MYGGLLLDHCILILQDYTSKPTSPVKQKDSERDPPKSPEYRQLSPKNLDDPIYPSGKTYLSAKCSSSETECLLEKNNNVLNISEKRYSRPGSEQLLKNELKQSSTILALAASQPDQPGPSAAAISGNSSPGSGKKKTLGELAKEWNSNQVLVLRISIDPVLPKAPVIQHWVKTELMSNNWIALRHISSRGNLH